MTVILTRSASALPTVVLVIFRVVSPPKPSAQSEVCQLDVAVAVDQDVVRLDVSVDEAHLVNTVHCADQLTDVKPANRQGYKPAF